MSSDLDDTLVADGDHLAALKQAAEAAQSRSAEAVGSDPQFYGFRIGASAIVLLDAIAYIGRRPGVPRVVRGGRARLVRVQSPTSEVSSTHLELRQLGRTVVVQDLHSTNGTRVAQPGHAARSLRSGESVVVTVGTLIDIGDGNVIEILAKQEKQ